MKASSGSGTGPVKQLDGNEPIKGSCFTRTCFPQSLSCPHDQKCIILVDFRLLDRLGEGFTHCVRVTEEHISTLCEALPTMGKMMKKGDPLNRVGFILGQERPSSSNLFL